MPLPSAPEDDFLAVARVVAAHGIRGEVRCEIITDFPERFQGTKRLLVGSQRSPADVERARLDRDRLLVKFSGVDTREAAERLRGLTLFVARSDAVPLPSGSYFWHDIIGLRVVTSAGADLGSISEILPTGGNDVYVVRTGDGEILLPAIKDVVRQIDLDARVMTVDLIEGLG